MAEKLTKIFKNLFKLTKNDFLSPILISSRILKEFVTAWISNKKVINLIHLIKSFPIKFATISHGILSSVNNFDQQKFNLPK